MSSKGGWAFIQNVKVQLRRAKVLASILAIILASLTAAADAQESAGTFDPYPLRPADTSSPRDTLQSFNAASNAAVQAWLAGKGREAIAGPASRASATMDFSQLASYGKLVTEIETLLMLREILDRVELPPPDQIPGDDEVAEGTIDRWTIPNTEISIARVEDGPRAGQYLFTAATVERLKEFYERASQLPYKPGAGVGIFDDFNRSPGLIVPRSWALALPQWSNHVILGQALWQWLSFFILAIMAVLVICWLLRWGRRWDGRRSHAWVLTRFGTPLSLTVSILVIYGFGYITVYAIRLYEWWGVLSLIIWTFIFVGIGWLIIIITGRIADAINDARDVKQGSVDAQLVVSVLRLTSLVILVFLFIYAANFFGVPLTPVIASLGVGGLAIALAVRPTLENVIGGLTLFADKPVRIGDYCRFGDDCGTVEEIGLRSTRLRKLDDTLVTVPNADFSQRELTNYTRRRQRLYRTTLGLRYETTPEQLRYVIARLREMLLGHPRVSSDMLHVRFHAFGAYSLDVEVFAYLRTQVWLEYRAIREDINLRIMDIVKEAGTGFAFPSQTAYLGRDSGLDHEKASQAEREVQVWRGKGQLPFPEFDQHLRWEKEDILDYPPQGSPGHKPRAGLSEPTQEPLAPPQGEESKPAERRFRFGFGARS